MLLLVPYSCSLNFKSTEQDVPLRFHRNLNDGMSLCDSAGLNSGWENGIYMPEVTWPKGHLRLWSLAV
jgi:hypothetical protein